MVNWKKIRGIGRISLLMGFGVTLSSELIINSLEPTAIEQTRVRKELREIAKKQEKILGIKHLGEPNISLRSDSFKISQDKQPGGYNSITNTIWIDLTRYNMNTLSHELGHYYVDKLSESLGNGNWPILELSSKDNKGKPPKDDKGNRVISEGIATYFELKTKIGIDTAPYTPLDYRNFEDYFKAGGNRAYYQIGYRLVKPILDKDINKGIELLIKNPPMDEDLKDLFSYREKILRKLEIETR